MTAARRKILFLTGTRADFGKLKALVAQVQRMPEFEYTIFATGMHMLARYGSTINEIRKAGFENIYPYVNQDGSITSQMDLVLANTVQGLGHYVREFRPDLIVVHGDRVEAMAGAIVGSLNNVLVAHIEGGELSGTVDELIRHSISKLSHIHFVANDEARERLIQMGELPESILVIGSPDIDIMLSDQLPSLDAVRERYEIPFDRYAILMYHPVTTEQGRLRRHAEAVVAGVRRSRLNYVVIQPNNDSGSDIVADTIGQLQDEPGCRLLPSMRFEHFLTLLKNAVALVGNSSAGIREAPVYGVPTVNIGSRQSNRFQYESIVNVAEDGDAIAAALGDLPQGVPPSLHFGNGNSAELFAAHIRSPKLWATPGQKQFRDLTGVVA